MCKWEILRLSKGEVCNIPHMGWSSLKLNTKSRLFSGILDGVYVYFVHSFYLRAEEETQVAATTEYGVPIHAAVEKDNVYACQFHPEKSGSAGLDMLRNFIAADRIRR